MQALHRFSAVLLADLRERTRSPRFWVLLAILMVAAWRCFPPIDAGYSTVSLAANERGAYSSAWIGLVMALEFSTLLSLGGFYLVRGTLVRDFDTRVWQLLVATPMTRAGFLLAKWASHMAVFALVIVASLCVGLVAQWVRAEDRSIDLFELIKPALVLSVPGLAVTSAMAIWFDLLPWLRRTAGNILFFILWVTLTSVNVSQIDNPDSATSTGWRSDPNGMVVAARDLHRVRMAQTGELRKQGFSVGVQIRKEPPELFEWKQWQVRPMDLLGRLLWLVAALASVMLAARVLDWAASRGAGATTQAAQSGYRLRWLDRVVDPLARISPLMLLAAAELKLYLRSRRRWWWALALVALGLQALGQEKVLHIGLLLAWILPLDLLSRAILREKDSGTGGLVFAAPQILRRLLFSRFTSGALLLLTLSLPGIIRLLASGSMGGIAALVITASIASWGLCMGALFRNAKPFELALVGAIYVGAQGAAIFDLGLLAPSTALWHALMLIPAWLVLAWAWPRLARC